ncbi:DNA polymerase [bacterium]|nr:DNA polymerase [bacterium]
MKLSSRTLQILKNFSTINPSLLFKTGSVLTTMSPMKTVMARATVRESFPQTYAIFDLSRFIGVLSMFGDPDVEMSDSFLVISEGNRVVNYTYADPEMIVTPPDKPIKFPDDAEIQFALPSDVLGSVLKAINILQMTEFSVNGTDGKIYVGAVDTKNPTGDTYKIEVGETNHLFSMIFKAENIKLISGDYDVKITSRGLGYFKGDDVEYWIPTESSSNFGS